jgi:hypothetical protein
MKPPKAMVSAAIDLYDEGNANVHNCGLRPQPE